MAVELPTTLGSSSSTKGLNSLRRCTVGSRVSIDCSKPKMSCSSMASGASSGDCQKLFSTRLELTKYTVFTPMAAIVCKIRRTILGLGSAKIMVIGSGAGALVFSSTSTVALMLSMDVIVPNPMAPFICPTRTVSPLLSR